MPERLSQPPRRTRFPWDDWMDGAWWLFVPGIDFPSDMTIEQFRTRCFTAASRKGKLARTALVDAWLSPKGWREADDDTPPDADRIKSLAVRFIDPPAPSRRSGSQQT